MGKRVGELLAAFLALVMCPHVTPCDQQIQAALLLHTRRCQVWLCYCTTLRHKRGRHLPFYNFPAYLYIVSRCFVQWSPVSALWSLPRDQIRRHLLCRLNWRHLIWSGMS